MAVDPKKKKHSMHGAMGALLDELDRSGGVLAPAPQVDATVKDSERRFPKSEPGETRSPQTPPPLATVSHSEPASLTETAEQLVKIPAARVRPWSLHNRQAPDMGDMQALIDSISTDGQHTPALIRPVHGPSDEGITHEVFAGFRRWTACRELNVDLLAIVRDVSDQEAAIIQETENEDREGISPASRALYYKSLLEQNIFPSETALASSLHLHRSTLNDLLSYTRIDARVVAAIGSIHVLPLRFAKVLATLSKLPENIEPLIVLGPEISTGKVSTRNIDQRLEAIKSGVTVESSTRTVKGKGGDLLTLRYDSNGTPVISILHAARSLTSVDELLTQLTAFLDQRHDQTS